MAALWTRADSSGSTTTTACTHCCPVFVAGFEVESGRVSRTAPIINYMLGWSPSACFTYCRGKKMAFAMDRVMKLNLPRLAGDRAPRARSGPGPARSITYCWDGHPSEAFALQSKSASRKIDKIFLVLLRGRTASRLCACPEPRSVYWLDEWVTLRDLSRTSVSKGISRVFFEAKDATVRRRMAGRNRQLNICESLQPHSSVETCGRTTAC